ncbi:Encoded by, partial [Rhizoctonia solani]
MRAPPPPVAKLQVSNARDVWYHQYPVRSKPSQLLTQSEIDNLIPAVKKYQADTAFDQIQHPSLEYKALMCVCCLYNGATKYYINREGGITGTIRDHMKKAHPSEYYSKCMREGLFNRCKDMPSNSLRTQPKFTLDGFIDHLVRWVVVDDQAFNLLDVPEFRDLMLYVGHGRIKDSDLPHRNKLEALAEAMYRIEKDYVDKEMLSKASRGLISLTSDLWSDIRIRSFMSVTAHYVNELGLLRDHLIAFRKLDGHHSGINIGQSLHQVLQELGVAHKIGYITLDNASNNHTAMITLADKLSPHGITFSPENNWIRCFPHILNLAVQTIIKSLGDSANRYRLSMESLNLAIGSASERYLQALESQPIDACRASVAACRSSGTRRERFESVIDTGNALGLFKHPDGTVITIDNLQLLRDSPVRWGSTYLMMDRYETMYPAITDFAFQMRREAVIPILDHSQYEVLQDLISILRIPYNAQEVLSSEKTPTLALAIPLFETITWSWEQLATLMPELSHAISCGIFKLQEYLGMFKDAPVHTIAMFLNPSIKLSWIQTHRSQTNIKEAEEIILDEMLRIQRDRPPPPVARSTLSARRAARAQSSGYLQVVTAGVNLRRASDASSPGPQPLSLTSSTSETVSWDDGPSPFEVDKRNRQIVQEEYQRYLDEPFVGQETMGSLDLVEYWINHQYTYPILYQIAMNVLPAQASSVSSERVFSSSKLTVTAQRTRLSASNVEYLQVLKHTLRRRRRDRLDGVTETGIEIEPDGLDFVSHLFESVTCKDEE